MKRDLVIGTIATAIVVAAGLAALQWHNTSSVAPTAQPTAEQPAVARNPAPPVSPSSPATSDSSEPSFDVVRVNPKGGMVVAGRAAPGADVTVLDGERVIGHVTADSNGEWVLTPTDTLPPGDHQLALTARSPGTGVVSKSEGVVAMVVPEAAASQRADSLAVLVPRAGSGPIRALQMPSRTSPRGVTVDVIEYDTAGHVQVLGRAEPQSSVKIYLNDRLVGSGVANASGGWSAALDGTVAVGRYRMRLEASSADGRSLGQVALAFERAETPVGYASVDVQPGNNLWRIAQHTYGEGLRYAEIYQANRAQIHDPNLIYPGQVIAVPAKR